MWHMHYLKNARKPLPQDPVLKDIVERNVIGDHYLEVEEDGELLIISWLATWRCVYVR